MAGIKALISLSFGGAIGLMFLMLGCALPIYKYVMVLFFLFECVRRILAPLRPLLLRPLAHPVLRSQEAGGRHGRHEQRLQGARHIPHDGRRRLGLWAARCICQSKSDQVGSLRTRPHRKHSHLRHHSGLLPGLREQRRLQLAAVVRRAADCCHMDFCRLLAVQAREMGTGTLSCVASPRGCPTCSLLTLVRLLFPRGLAKD